jgi:hypothetical protein
MQPMSQYLLELKAATGTEARGRLQAVSQQIEEWLRGKGYSGNSQFKTDGRAAELALSDYDVGGDEMRSWTLLEELKDGFIETQLRVARQDLEVRFWCSLSAGQGNNRIAPMNIDIFCPTVVRQVLGLGSWYLGDTPLSDTPLFARGAAEGDRLAAVLLDGMRSLPIVVISTHFGMLLHADLPSRMAKALTGLALVVVSDDPASWHLTSRVGKSHSCFNGAVRLYWPGFSADAPPLRHPLWTAQRLLERVPSVEAAVKGICGELRRKLNAVSVLALVEPPMMNNVRRAAHEQAALAERQDLQDREDYRSLADSYAGDNAALRLEIDTLNAQLAQVRSQLYRFQVESAWSDVDAEAVAIDAVEPETLADSVDRARVLHAGWVRFGDDVQAGVAALAPDAGPPGKVYTYLDTLGQLARARRDAPLGIGMIQWLSGENVTASTESETVTKNKAEMQRRTWSDGSGRRAFELHLKPNDGAHPDKCVRIYFDWDEASQQIVVGWVGRHP